MSLFRTLQSSASTVTIFHSSKVPLLQKLFGILTQANYKLNDDKQRFIVDLMEDTIPTYDQYATIAHSCLKDTYSKHALNGCFPFVSGKTDGPTGKDRTTITAPAQLGRLLSNGMKMFNEGEYAMIYEAFSSVADLKQSEFDTTQIFLPPLVVDWDQNLIANDESGLSKILDKYRADVG